MLVIEQNFSLRNLAQQNFSSKMTDKNLPLTERIAKFLIVGFFKVLWWLIRWAARKLYFRLLPDRMCIAPSKEVVEDFYKSKKWYRLSLAIKNKYRHPKRGLECMKCGRSHESHPRLKFNTDHIKPLWYYWHRRLDPNMQILCVDCNRGKGSVDMTDYRGYRPGKTPIPASHPVPRRPFHVVNTTHWKLRGHDA
jgi:5-methylcytosine-specific restriction endonuclease McrA